ncbi:MAG: DUF4982 domain-containing protein [Treponema sp.]|jgi:beta-galactosidase|nr:DUF4982 domain-containing protein [Treponema sp.]
MYLEQTSCRVRQWFGFDWKFKLEEENDFRPVQLPHDWSVEYGFDENAPSYGSGGYVKTGKGVYVKRFTVDPSAKGKKISLHFDGAYMCAGVFLNGNEIGSHVYGYTPFEMDITDNLNFNSENELVVKIDNSRQPGSRWYSGSGITRDLWIISVSPAHIKTFGTFIRAGKIENDSAVLLIDTDIIPPDGNAQLNTSIFNKDDKLVNEASFSIISEADDSRKASRIISQEIEIRSPKLWSNRDPYMYRAESTLIVNGETTDVYITPFGIRKIEFTPDKSFIINGKQVKLRGVCLHHDGGSVGAAVPLKLWKRRLIRLIEMGINAVRFSHNPPDPGLLDLCDSLGLYVMDEAFDEWALLKSKALGSNTHQSSGYSQWFYEHHEEDLTAMILRDRNHPSVIIWSIGNEVPEQTQAEGYKTAQKLIDICHNLDPTRLCTQANDQICAEPKAAAEAFLNTLDIVGYNYTGRWRSRAETLYESDKRSYPGRLIIGAENTCAAGRRGDYSLKTEGTMFWHSLYYTAAARVQKLLRFTETHDYVAGDFMWTGVDYLGEAHWPNRSACCGVLDTCGFPKDHYYFYKSIWRREEPFVYIFPHWNMDLAQGTVIPVLCYTNCEQAEVFINGKSYGKKAYSYPLYGMTEIYGHFDKPPVPYNTDDMFLGWDVPYNPGTIEARGFNDGKEVSSHVIKTAGAPKRLSASTDTRQLSCDGRDIAHIEVQIKDDENNLCPNADNRIYVNIEGPAQLIGIDNGKPDCMDSFKGNSMEAMAGLLLIIIRSKREAGEIKIKLSAGNLESCDLLLRSQ